MAYFIDAGIQVSLGKTSLGVTTTDPSQMVWYRFTDHNREPISINTEIIESAQRMANGKMRKYIVAKKDKISTSWKYVPSKQTEAVDGFYTAAWIESFYQSNAGLPIYLKIVTSGLDSTLGTAVLDQTPSLGSLPSGSFVTAQTGYKVYSGVYITDFSKTIINRTKLSDYVDMSIEFTEI